LAVQGTERRRRLFYFERDNEQGFHMGILRPSQVVPILVAILAGQLAASPALPQGRGVADDTRADILQEQARSTPTPTAVTRRRDLESILGKEVRTQVEEDLGRIVDLLADREGAVQAAVIEFGGFLGIGTRKIAVEWSALRFEMDGKRPAIIVDLRRSQLRAAPEYKPSEPVVVVRTFD
jgi:hypothetical protein